MERNGKHIGSMDCSFQLNKIWSFAVVYYASILHIHYAGIPYKLWKEDNL